MGAGALWAIDAYGCDPAALRSPSGLAELFAALVADGGLHAVGDARWHVFPGAGGITGLQLLSESHLACHTYPEHGFATIDLHCCRDGAAWDWEARLREFLGARRVSVRRLARGTEIGTGGSMDERAAPGDGAASAAGAAESRT